MKKILIFALLIISLIINAQQPEGNWDRLIEMKPGYFRVIKNSMVGLVSSDGTILIPCEFDQVFDLTEDNYVKVLKNRKTGLYHLDIGLILPAEYDQIWAFEGNIAKVLKDRKLGFVSREGYIVIPVEYSHIWAEENGLIKVLKNGKTGYYDLDGNVVIPAEYQIIWSFDGNLAKVQKNGKIGYVDRDGNEVIPAIYDKIGTFENGKARATLDGVIFFIDKDGNILEIHDEISVIPTTQQPPVFEDFQSSEKKTDNIIRQSGNRNVNYSASKTATRKYKSFKGHLSSFMIGINGYVNSNFEDMPPVEYGFMEIDYNNSCEITLYPWQHSTRLIGSHFGLVTSLGVQFNNYRFHLYNSNELLDNELAKSWFPRVEQPNSRINKAKLINFYLNVPVMLELQLPDGRGRKGIYLSGGVIGGLKINTHTKIVYDYRNVNYKHKHNRDLGLQMFRYSYMARAGYKNVGIYATYSPMSLFKKNKGPELFPYSVGLTLNF